MGLDAELCALRADEEEVFFCCVRVEERGLEGNNYFNVRNGEGGEGGLILFIILRSRGMENRNVVVVLSTRTVGRIFFIITSDRELNVLV